MPSSLRRRVPSTPGHPDHRELQEELRPEATSFAEPFLSDLGPAAHGISRGGAPSSRACAAGILPLRRTTVYPEPLVSFAMFPSLFCARTRAPEPPDARAGECAAAPSAPRHGKPCPSLGALF